MKKDLLYNDLLEAIKSRIPQKSKLTNTLVNMLFIEKEAVYRRLRGEVPFTFAEIAIIAKGLGISLDSIVGSDMSRSRPFQLKMINYEEPDEVDLMELQRYVDVLKMTKDDPSSVMAEAANSVPSKLYYPYKYLNNFFFFKGLYQFGNNGGLKSYKDTVIPEKLLKLQRATIIESKNIGTTYYIFDNLIFQYLVNDIKYFEGIRLVTKEEIQLIKEELHQLLNNLEVLAAKGKYDETGNPIYFYISHINFEASYSYMEMKQLRFSLVHAFLSTGMSSMEEQTFERQKKWIQSLKRSSIMISVSGERQRILFFDTQREIVDTL